MKTHKPHHTGTSCFLTRPASKKTKSRTAIIRIVCPDQKGLVARFASFLANHGLNILDSEDHGEDGRFFQRIAVDIAEIDIPIATLENLLAKECAKIGGTCEVLYSHRPKRVAIFVSRENHCLYELLIEHEKGDLPGDISLVVSNHRDLENVAKHFGIHFCYFPIKAGNKGAQERREIALLESRNIDLVVLARYMQVLSPKFVGAFRGKIINVHPSFLPTFPGINPYAQAYARGVKSIGATAHFVTEKLDDGAYICQETTRCTHHDMPADLQRKGRHVERRVLLRAVKANLEGRLFISSNENRVIEL